MRANRSIWCRVRSPLIATVLCCLITNVCAGATLYEQMQAALEARKKAEEALKGIVVSPQTQQHLEQLIGERLLELGEGDVEYHVKAVWAQLTAAEQGELTLWLTARAARNAAEAMAANAEKAYYNEFVKKDGVLNQAQTDFEAEQKYLEQEKTALKSMPGDDAYLDRVSKLLDRLKKSYEKMKTDVGPYTNDFADARIFLADKEERLKKIAALEAEIARRRGKGGDANANTGDTTATDANANRPGPDGQPVPPPPGPLGDTYTLAGGPFLTNHKNEPIGVPLGTIKKADGTGIEIEVTDGDKTGKARITIAKGPPQSVRINERVDLSISAAGETPAFVTAQWYTDNVFGGRIPGGESSCSNLPNWRAQSPSVGNMSFYFGAKEPVEIKLNAGRYDRENVWIVWRYAKSN